MGFYIRKSIKAGPFRFNLSKSGIGVSTGIKGFRVGAGPRGNYVHMGANGLYYRKTLSGARPAQDGPVESLPMPGLSQSIQDGHDGFKEIESAEISQLTDSTSAELLAEFDAKHKSWRSWPWVLVLGVAIYWMLPPETPEWLKWSVVVIGLVVTIAAYVYDDFRKSVVLFYDLDSACEAKYEAVHEAFSKMQTAHKIWHVESQANVLDRKRFAGASQLIKKTGIFLAKSNPAYVKTNISVLSIPVGKQILFFFPDRLLVFEGKGVGAVSYGDLIIDIESTRFIEDGAVPRDTQIVDSTWRYVNKSGGPDRRFKDNKEIPICLYEDMHLRSRSGLNELVQFSRVGDAQGFKDAILGLSRAVSGPIRVSA